MGQVPKIKFKGLSSPKKLTENICKRAPSHAMKFNIQIQQKKLNKRKRNLKFPQKRNPSGALTPYITNINKMKLTQQSGSKDKRFMERKRKAKQKISFHSNRILNLLIERKDEINFQAYFKLIKSLGIQCFSKQIRKTEYASNTATTHDFMSQSNPIERLQNIIQNAYNWKKHKRK